MWTTRPGSPGMELQTQHRRWDGHGDSRARGRRAATKHRAWPRTSRLTFFKILSPKATPCTEPASRAPADPRRASQTTGSQREVSPLPLPVPSVLRTHTLVHTTGSSPRSLSLRNLRVYREVKEGVRQESDPSTWVRHPRRVSAETQRPDHRETIRLF